jgi:hypothetical protein
LFGCWWWNPGGSAQVNVGITNASGNSVYAANRQYNESGYAQQDFKYRFPSSLNQLALGSFNFTASTSGDAYVSNMYSRMVYSQDPCFFNYNYSYFFNVRYVVLLLLISTSIIFKSINYPL